MYSDKGYPKLKILTPFNHLHYHRLCKIEIVLPLVVLNIQEICNGSVSSVQGHSVLQMRLCRLSGERTGQSLCTSELN